MPARMLFADTFYWVALLNARDPFYARVASFSRALGTARLVTADEVLTEVLNWFSQSGRLWRGKAATLIHNLRSNPNVDVLGQTRADFDAALAQYEARPDKGYSLTDCRSMVALRALGVSEVAPGHRFS
jgi:uncharacterized protein